MLLHTSPASSSTVIAIGAIDLLILKDASRFRMIEAIDSCVDDAKHQKYTTYTTHSYMALIEDQQFGKGGQEWCDWDW